jgi:hypothetical protein
LKQKNQLSVSFLLDEKQANCVVMDEQVCGSAWCLSAFCSLYPDSVKLSVKVFHVKFRLMLVWL